MQKSRTGVILSPHNRTRRDVLGGFGALIFGAGALALAGPRIVEAAKTPAQPWHGYTQAKRNSLIIERGLKDLKDPPLFVDKVCKPWVQTVVTDASKSVVTVPTTTQNGNGGAWKGCPNQDIAYRKNQIYAVQPGDIIQMQWGTAKKQDSTGGYFIPHTVIVRSVSGSGWKMSMVWLDSNWLNDKKVRSHTISLDYFSEKVIEQGLDYNVYMIL